VGSVARVHVHHYRYDLSVGDCRTGDITGDRPGEVVGEVAGEEETG
jgi:hypothetical protein